MRWIWWAADGVASANLVCHCQVKMSCRCCPLLNFSRCLSFAEISRLSFDIGATRVKLFHQRFFLVVTWFQLSKKFDTTESHLETIIQLDRRKSERPPISWVTHCVTKAKLVFVSSVISFTKQQFQTARKRELVEFTRFNFLICLVWSQVQFFLAETEPPLKPRGDFALRNCVDCLLFFLFSLPPQFTIVHQGSVKNGRWLAITKFKPSGILLTKYNFSLTMCFYL